MKQKFNSQKNLDFLINNLLSDNMSDCSTRSSKSKSSSSCTNSNDGRDLTVFSKKKSNNKLVDVKLIKGEKGERGCRGKQGKCGVRGHDGQCGKKGRKGRKGVSFCWKGEWNQDIEYDINDVVYYNSSTYIAIEFNVNSNPEIDKCNWNLMVSGSIQGDQGEKGDQGEQ